MEEVPCLRQSAPEYTEYTVEWAPGTDRSLERWSISLTNAMTVMGGAPGTTDTAQAFDKLPQIFHTAGTPSEQS